MIELSVIIPTLNRPSHLTRILNGLAGQNFDPRRFEVIVVDNAATDKARVLVSEFRMNMPYELTYVWEPNPGLHRARHAGMRAAKAELLVFADDDILPFPSWLDAIFDAFTSTDAMLVGGKNLPKWERQPPRWIQRLWEPCEGIRMNAYLSILDLGDETLWVDPRLVWGCNFSIRKSVLLEAKGFHPDGMPDDLIHFRGDGETYVSDFVASKGHQAFYHPLASVFHLVTVERMTIKYFKKRAFNQGVSDSFTKLRRLEAKLVNSAPNRGFISSLMRLKPINSFFRILLPRHLYCNAIIEDAYYNGFIWHQNLFHKDETMRSWVLRPDYLEG